MMSTIIAIVDIIPIILIRTPNTIPPISPAMIPCQPWVTSVRDSMLVAALGHLLVAVRLVRTTGHEDRVSTAGRR